MVRIHFKNRTIHTWKPEDYTEYRYDGKCFIVIKGEQWVGIYNMDTISFIEIESEGK